MASLSNTIIPVTPEEAREQASAMVAVALFVVAVFSCALGSGLGFLIRGVVLR